MELLYVVELTIDGDGAFERTQAHIAEWLSAPTLQIEPSQLSSNGEMKLAPNNYHNAQITRHAKWEVVSTGAKHGIKLTVSQESDAILELSTRVTLTKVDAVTTVRIGIGRQSQRNQLIPVAATRIFQPRLLAILDQDESLTLRTQGQLINRRYVHVRTNSEVQELAASLPIDGRLPLTLIHLRSKETWELAHELSQKLLGLTRVVAVNFESSRMLSTAVPDMKIPFGGLLIAYPGLASASLTLTSGELATRGRKLVREELIQHLGSIAALANGEDRNWAEIRSAAENQRLIELTHNINIAKAAQDAEGQIAALTAKVTALEVAKQELEEIGEEALEQADASARKVNALESQLKRERSETESWREAYFSAAGRQEEGGVDTFDPWSSIPALAANEDPSETFLAISDASGERIVFTDRARKSWKSIQYPEPADMTEKLVALARAAAKLYDGTDRSIPHLDDWIKVEFGLTVALTDQTISKWKQKEMRWLNDFSFDGITLDATPHVKVRDAVKFNECGRIHFALDKLHGRFVVQHVGTKTYK